MEPAPSSSRAEPTEPNRRGWSTHPIILLLKFKLFYLAILINALLSFPTSKDADIFHSKRQAWTLDRYLTFESHFVAWDSEHYVYLSEKGYEAGAGACAFYPLWPMMVRYFSPLVGGGKVLGGMVLANLVSLVGFYLFFRLVQRRFGDATAWRAVVFLLAFPGSLFFQFNYTEGLFLLLLMLLCLALDEGHTALALVTSFLLPLTRGVGIFCVFPLLVHVCRHNERIRGFFAGLVAKQKWLPERARTLISGWFEVDQLEVAGSASSPRLTSDFTLLRPGTGAARGGRVVTTPWLVAASVYGWILYLTLMWHWTGNPFEGFAAQRYWGVQSIGNLFDVPKFVHGFFTPTTWHEFNGSFLDRAVFVLCMATLPVVWKMDKVWFVWVLVLGLVPAMSGTFVSFTRFAAVVFPVFIALAVLLARPERWLLRYVTVGFFSVLHGLLVWRFVNYRWAG